MNVPKSIRLPQMKNCSSSAMALVSLLVAVLWQAHCQQMCISINQMKVLPLSANPDQDLKLFTGCGLYLKKKKKEGPGSFIV